jgi:hypothetical protein
MVFFYKIGSGNILGDSFTNSSDRPVPYFLLTHVFTSSEHVFTVQLSPDIRGRRQSLAFAAFSPALGRCRGVTVLEQIRGMRLDEDVPNIIYGKKEKNLNVESKKNLFRGNSSAPMSSKPAGKIRLDILCFVFVKASRIEKENRKSSK